jgi:hypothetical protein
MLKCESLTKLFGNYHQIVSGKGKIYISEITDKKTHLQEYINHIF